MAIKPTMPTTTTATKNPFSSMVDGKITCLSIRNKRVRSSSGSWTLFTLRFSERGNVIAYEERIKGGVVLWDLNGKRIGSRYVDLRSRGTNAHSSGLTIVFVPRESERLALAQVTIEDIKQHLGIQN
jgi:hypothetical protein